MSENEIELRANKLEIVQLLADQLSNTYKLNEYKDFKIADDKPIAYIDATIDLLKAQVKNAKAAQAKLVGFDKLEKERANLSPEDFKKLQEEQNRLNEEVDSFLATLEPRASFRANIQAPNTVILRYRGNGIDKEFSEKYPFGVLL